MGIDKIPPITPPERSRFPERRERQDVPKKDEEKEAPPTLDENTSEEGPTQDEKDKGLGRNIDKRV